MTVRVSDIGIVINTTTKFRRMPPLFPATDRPADIQGHAELWLEREVADITDADRDLWSARMSDFMEEVGTPIHPSDGDRQRACDENNGHVLTVDRNKIVCTHCYAEWRHYDGC